MYALCLILVLIATSSCSAIPKPNEHKDRKYDPELSDEKHMDGGEHNTEYDHDAFLGRDQSKEFDKLTPEESKRRLGIIVGKIDTDGDGLVTQDELKKWISHVQQRYIVTESKRQWDEIENKKNDKLEWEHYKQRTYGFTNEEMDQNDPNYSHRDMVLRDKRRWQYADSNKDGVLDLEEFTHFSHPEEVPHMKEVVVMETLDDIDKDKDGKISLDEYIGDMWPDGKDNPGKEEPEWVKSEREQFHTFRDTDKSGHLDRDEVKEWIMPSEYDHVENEAQHLVTESDKDGDGKLTKDEIVEKYEVFVGSQATDYGEILNKHDEF